MNIDSLRKLCLSFPAATEEIKWGHDLCFSVGEKMFCITVLNADEGVSFKVLDEEFEELTSREGTIPAPYMARNKWVYVLDLSRLTEAEWQHYVRQSYDLVKGKLPNKVQDGIG